MVSNDYKKAAGSIVLCKQTSCGRKLSVQRQTKVKIHVIRNYIWHMRKSELWAIIKYVLTLLTKLSSYLLFSTHCVQLLYGQSRKKRLQRLRKNFNDLEIIILTTIFQIIFLIMKHVFNENNYFNELKYHITRQVSSMIHSAKPEVQPVAITIFTLNVFCFEKWGRTDGRTTCVKIMITTGRDCGSTSWINYILIYF